MEHSDQRARSGALVGLALCGLTVLAGDAAMAQAPETMVGRWQLVCQQDRCRGMLGVREGDSFVLGLVVQPAADGAVNLLMRVPLDTVLPPGARIYGGRDRFIDLTYQTCGREGCDAVTRIEGAGEALLRSSNQIRATYLLQDPQNDGSLGYSVDVRIDGFGELIDRLRSAR